MGMIASLGVQGGPAKPVSAVRGRESLAKPVSAGPIENANQHAPHEGMPIYGCPNAPPIYSVPQYIGLHSQILGHPSIWGRIPTYVGVPKMWECIPIHWANPVYDDVNKHIPH